jgi:hypothetical protein
MRCREKQAMQDNVREAVAEFVGAFEEVFGRDWEYSKIMLSPANLDFFVTPGCTFINPGVEDEVEDWGARAEHFPFGPGQKQASRGVA